MEEYILHIAFVTIGLAVFFDFSNGFHDSSNIVATMVSSGAMSPQSALITAAVFEFVGAFFLGTAVARTIGKGIVEPSSITIDVVLATLIGAISWNLATWYFGMPSSSSHALIGGLLGTVYLSAGKQAIKWFVLDSVILILVISPIIGMLTGYFSTRIMFSLFPNIRPSRANYAFKRLQILSSIWLALSHGTNDAQKTMGVITLSLAILYPLAPEKINFMYSPSPDGVFFVPTWVILICSLAIALGIASGGWRIIKTLGLKLYKIRPVHGFCSQASSGAVIYLSAIFGFPVSTTQIISSSVMGAGSAQRVNAVRWGMVKNILLTWLITIPASALISGLIYYGIHYLRIF